MYLKFAIWKVELFPRGEDTHRMFFDSPSSKGHFSLSQENTFQIEVSTLQQTGGPSQTSVEITNPVWTGNPWDPHTTEMFGYSHQSYKTHHQSSLMYVMPRNTYLYLKSAGTPSKRLAFGHDRFYAPAKTHPSVSMVRITLSLQQQMLSVKSDQIIKWIPPFPGKLTFRPFCN